MGCTPWMTFFGFVTLTFELDLDIIRHDLNAKIQDCMYVHSARIVRQTYGQIHRQTAVN